MLSLRRALAALLLLSAATVAGARVISYAPYSDRVSIPILQSRLNRHIAIIEGATGPGTSPIIGAPPPYYSPSPFGQIVIYDTKGLQEPAVVFPPDGTSAYISAAAMREDTLGTPEILVQTQFDFGGQNPQHLSIWLLSMDGGKNWKQLNLGTAMILQAGTTYSDHGGPFTHALYSPIRTGTDQFPFIVANADATRKAFLVGADGTPVALQTLVATGQTTLAGADIGNSRFLLRNANDAMSIVDVNGTITPLGSVDPTALIEGWITSDGAAFLQESRYDGRFLYYVKNGTRTFVAGPIGANGPPPPGGFIPADPEGFFAIPTADYSGAWMIQRHTGQPTTLSLYTPLRGVVQQWSDVSAPEVEAILAGRSGTSVLIQVHRPRQAADQRLFKDPALAVWHVGDPAPRGYDELYLNEAQTKGFVHVDVDKIEDGEMFVFDSGPSVGNNGGGGVIISPPPPSSGGSDVFQEWGVVKASLQQRLVLPGISHTPGAYGSFWLSDVIFQNPADTPQDVQIRYAPTGDVEASVVSQTTITLKPHEIRVVTDALKTIFGIETGGGAFFLTPQNGGAINVTSRTYTQSATGSYGFGMNGIDIFAAASARFPVTFAGAFQGQNFRTNLVLTDVSGRGTNAALFSTGPSGPSGNSGVSFNAGANGQQQINGIGGWLGLSSSDTGALVVQPTHGETIASVFTIDNRTNDPTYFPPDLPSPVVRTIPAIGHIDGANGSKFRSDLFLYNPSNVARTVTLQEKSWDNTDNVQTLQLLMLPGEARIIRDVLFNAFGRTGIGRLRYETVGDTIGIRVTSRTYTVDTNGGTYGFLMPPLNSFQNAGPGDALDILGAVGDPRFRTNVGIVDLAAFQGNANSRATIEIFDNSGKSLDKFEVQVPSSGGIQINDIFHNRGLGDGPPAALIRVSSIVGVIGAYATIIDNGTNDPTYLAPNLAAKP